MTEPTYKNITATVRTPRCAILIDENSANWKAAASGAIACASEIWGGRHFLIIPTDGARIKDKFWEILEAYNPDHIAVYHLTFADMELAAPDQYSATKERYRQAYDKQGFSLDFEEWFAEEAALSEIDELAISEELEKELIARLSPFHFDGRASRQYLSRRSGFDYPFTKILNIIPFTTRHIGAVTLAKDVDDPTLALLIHSQTGIARKEYRKGIADAGFALTHLPDDYDNGQLLAHTFGGKHVPLHPNAVDDYMPSTPFGLSMLHLGQYYRLDRHHEEKESVVVVLGDTVDDFCLYYSLSRLHERVCWLPLSWLRDCRRVVAENRRRYERGEESQELDVAQTITRGLIHLFFELADYGHRTKRIELRSMSLSRRQLLAYRRQMSTCGYFDHSRYESVTDCVEIDQSSTVCFLQVFEENNYINHRSVVFMEGESVSPFDTPKPKNFSIVAPPHHYWITSLRIEGYEPPPLSNLGTRIVDIHSSTIDSRIASDGIAYHCPNFGYFGGDIDVNLVRPKIRMPDEMALLSAYFESIGVTIRYSDKGNYFIDTVERFGGLDEVGRFIKSVDTRSVLEKFMARQNAADGSVIYLTNDQRAYLNLEALASSLGGKDQAAKLADDLVGKRVLQRGYILQCQRCRLSSWYGLEALASDFTCNRCSFKQQFTQAHWKQPVEPHWYYRLAETVYQFYDNDSHLTAQTLFNLKARSKLAFHYVPEIELVGFPADGQKREMDVACLLDGQIVLGECKTGDLQPRDVIKFESLIEKHPRRPDIVVFATAKDTVADAFAARAGGIKQSEILTFGDLYDR